MAATEDSFQNIDIWADSTIHLRIAGADIPSVSYVMDTGPSRGAPALLSIVNENRAPGNNLAPCELAFR